MSEKKKDDKANLVEEVDEESTLLMLESSELIHIDKLAGKKFMLNEERVLPKLYFAINEAKDAIWYNDTRYSNHMIGNRMALMNLYEIVKGNVRFEKEFVVKVEGRGTTLFKIQNERQFNLENIYYIPRLKSNIISVQTTRRVRSKS